VCGVRREVSVHTLLNGSSRSCGCYRSEVSRELCAKLSSDPDSIAKMADAIAEKHRRGDYDVHRIREMQRQAVEKLSGSAATGLNQKGEKNHIAKQWAVKSPSGAVLEGKSLRNLVRENAHLFDERDVAFRKNKHGTDLWCAADMGLRKLFRDKKPVHSWKGWTRADRVSKPDGLFQVRYGQ
jgi:hypothetical protein